MDTSFVANLANSRLAFSAITLVGLAMCTPGIGKAARLGLWTHPVTIAGYIFGAAALVLAAQAIFRLRIIPLTNLQALLAILAIIVIKIGLATLYRA